MNITHLPVTRIWEGIVRKALETEGWSIEASGVKGAAIAVGACGGIAIFFHVEGAVRGAGWYSAYYSQGDNREEEHAIDEDAARWLDNMAGVDWSAWVWDGPYLAIPIIY